MLNLRQMMLTLLAGSVMTLTGCSHMATGDDVGHKVHSGKTDHVYYNGHYRHSGGSDNLNDGTYQDASMRRHQSRYVREDDNDAVIDSGLMLVTKHVPTEANFGQEYVMEIEAKALENVRDVKVITTIPEGAEFVRADPPARRDGNDLIWEFDRMKLDEAKDIMVTFRATQEGELASCTAVHALPLGCVITDVGRAELEIMKSGPDQADLNATVPYSVTVKNSGTTTAKDVVIMDPVPAGMSGSAKRLEVGDLEPGESRTMEVAFTADRTGRVCNEATADSSNAGSVSADACTQIVEKNIEIAKSGTAREYVNKTANYSINVRNSGDVALDNVKVSDRAPSGTQMVSADGASMSGNSAHWNIDRLEAGESRSFSVSLKGLEAGNRCNNADVSAHGMNKSAEACTEWVGMAAILVEMVDVSDPHVVGEMETYKIRITNQGTADDTNVSMMARLTGEMKPVSASGATQCQVSGQSVSCAPYATLGPKQTIEYTIEAEAQRTGDARIRLEVNSDILDRPVIEEESTHIY